MRTCVKLVNDEKSLAMTGRRHKLMTRLCHLNSVTVTQLAIFLKVLATILNLLSTKRLSFSFNVKNESQNQLSGKNVNCLQKQVFCLQTNVFGLSKAMVCELQSQSWPFKIAGDSFYTISRMLNNNTENDLSSLNNMCHMRHSFCIFEKNLDLPMKVSVCSRTTIPVFWKMSDEADLFCKNTMVWFLSGQCQQSAVSCIEYDSIYLCKICVCTMSE